MTCLRWLIPALVLAGLACAPGAAEAQRAQPRIIGGTGAPISSLPFQVALYRNNRFLCGGSIRDSTHVITAAHCVTLAGQPLSGSYEVGYGSDALATQERAAVESSSVPPEYVGDRSYDAALLTLSTPIDLSGPNAKSIPLAEPALSKSSGTAMVSGWGEMSEGSGAASPTLQAVEVPLLADQPCADYDYGALAYVAARAVCAGGGSLDSGNPDACQGDSGGPLAVDLDPSAGRNFVLLGITSFGDGCGRKDTPAVYTYTRGAGIDSFLRAEESQAGTAPATPVATPIVPPAGTPATRDTARPSAKLSKLSCTKRRKCSFRVAAGDTGGTVTKLSATVSRKVRTCRRRGEFRVCRTTTRKKTLKPKRVGGHFTFSATLFKATYKLSAVATDAAGNRSKSVTRTFRVR